MVLGIIIALIVVGGIIYYSQSQTGSDAAGSDEATLQELNDLIEEGSGIPDISTPSANPLDSVAPSGNPIEKANPFTNDYANPFE